LHTDLATLLIRLLFGGMFIFHGWPKLSNYSGMLEMFGDPIGLGTKLSLILVIFAEVFCGIFILIGFATRFAVVPIFITMLVAFFVAHAKDPFMNKMIPFIYLWLCLAIFLLGSGRYSVDNLIFNNRNKQQL
jgi:putative oxidoreductase